MRKAIATVDVLGKTPVIHRGGRSCCDDCRRDLRDSHLLDRHAVRSFLRKEYGPHVTNPRLAA